MKNKNNLTEKEQKIFWKSILFGIGGGVLGNLFTSLWTHLLILQVEKFSWGNLFLWAIFIIIFLLLVGVILKIGKKLK